jgi:predicted dehydrogenase
MDELRLGTIGSGSIVHSILDNVKIVDGIRLEAVYSRSEEKGRALASKYGAEKVYTDMEGFLADEETNVVYIATPNLLHYEQAKAALQAGKNVICEKPFCTKAEHAKELIALAKEKHLFLVEAVTSVFLPNFEALKRELPKIGRIKLVLSNYSQYSGRYDRLLDGEVPNIFNPEFAGGCLMDINYYNVYLNVALFGKPNKAVYYPNMHEIRIDTSGIMILQYDGFVSSCAGAKDTWGVNSFQIEGEKGYIYIKGSGNAVSEVEAVTKTSKETINLQDNPDRWYYEVQKLTQLMLEGDYDAVYRSLDITLDAVGIIENARKEAGIIFPGD